MLSFLPVLYYNGMQYQTINLYRSAISMTHAPVDGCIIGSHPIVSHFMKGIFQLRMPTPKYLLTWDVSVVLGYLKTLESKELIIFKAVNIKTCHAHVDIVLTSQSHTIDPSHVDIVLTSQPHTIDPSQDTTIKG